jgi:hypothetical protein
VVVAGQAEEGRLQRGAALGQPGQGDALGGGDAADLIGAGAAHLQGGVAGGRDVVAAAEQGGAQPGGLGGADRHHGGGQLRQRPGEPQAPLVDDDHTIDGLGDLGQRVAGDQDGAPLPGHSAQ